MNELQRSVIKSLAKNGDFVTLVKYLEANNLTITDVKLAEKVYAAAEVQEWTEAAAKVVAKGAVPYSEYRKRTYGY